MAREIWKNISWFRKVYRNTAKSIQFDHRFYPEIFFRQKLVQERRRAERSSKPLVVMIVNTVDISNVDSGSLIIDSLVEGINTCVRGTDICGQLKYNALIGVILTEVESDKVDSAKRIVAKKMREKLVLILNDEIASRIAITFRIYPEVGGGGDAFDMTFYPEIRSETIRKIGGQIVKRAIDILGSIMGLVLFFPAFVLLPIIIKFTSEGSVFYRQMRIGRNGKTFDLIKFRTMYVGNDDIIHREYVKRLIKSNLADRGTSPMVFKIVGDPRITIIGRVLRKYSLDELPQFINVLKGDMSLVGPRPPICYELEHYCSWQRNRLIGKRPGITGPWQVSGRSSTSFDDMVRLDLRYLKGGNIALDLKIMLRTPIAVLRCRGAY